MSAVTAGGQAIWGQRGGKAPSTRHRRVEFDPFAPSGVSAADVGAEWSLSEIWVSLLAFTCLCSVTTNTCAREGQPSAYFSPKTYWEPLKLELEKKKII